MTGLAAANPWGCPPSLCTQQQYSGAASAILLHRLAVTGSQLQGAGHHSGRQLQRVGMSLMAPHSLQPPRCSIRRQFAAGGSSADSLLQPQLLPFPELPDPQQQLLCDTLLIQPSQAELILLACPGAATVTAAQLAKNWRQLQQRLPLPQHMLLQAVLQVPDLLVRPRQTLAARLAEAAAVLQLPVQRLRARRQEQTVQLHWRLLVTPQQQLQQQLQQLMQMLAGLQQQHVVQLVLAEPRLLARDPAQLLSTVEALEQICGCQLARLYGQLRYEPRLLAAPADSLYTAAAGLQQLLRLSEEGLTLVVRRAPAALIVPPERLHELLDCLPPTLSTSQEVAADILLQEPGLLTRSAGAVLAVLNVLRSQYKLNAEALLQVVQFDPSILALSAGQLGEDTKHFKRLAASHLRWQAEYRYLMSKPANVARALRIEPLRLQRVVYLERQGLAGTISLRNALTLSGRKFVLLYPKYPAWLGQAYSGGNAPRRYAAATAASSYEEDSEEEGDY